ncbi:EthD domain-containing protein [Nocardia sp. CA2R105]|uniref:EthD domain-containing protein n=1 Tax=Nocardia coffeae TaxID=2873381 RepID=UPI001CA622C7|nr:EthD domain-containing protein [Nocardia coffeae]MBY8863730.1 EthD domain-containing protein [Nocardia coffeae]
MKLMYALWGSALAETLRSPDAHTRLARAGATGLQVNVVDDDVAAANLRLSTYDEPVAAVVSVWTETGQEPITRELTELADRVEGWIVEERVPMRPPATADGVRFDALSNIAFLRIPSEMTPEAWRRYWHEVHTTIAMETQATFGYLQNTVVSAITPGRRVDGLVEELFPMAAMTDPHAFWGSGGDDAELQRRVTRMMTSIDAFGANREIDVVPTSRYHYDLR